MAETDGVPKPPSHFTGSEKYWQAAEDWYNLTLTKEQREILESVADNQYTIVQSANGAGKTLSAVALALTFRLRHYPSSVVVTSGTYGKLKRTFCADAERLHLNTDVSFGEWKWSPNPTIDVEGDPTWQFEIASPEDAGELEGVHNDHVLAIVEEADKDAVDDSVIDSIDSLLSDENDKMLVICNPPEDESNVVYDLWNDPNYNNIQYSTFDSHNVQVEIGNREGPKINGLAGLTKLKKKWRSFNNEEWPGYEVALTAHEKRDDLDARWYRRFAGVMPPDTAATYRPFTINNVEDAYEETAEPTGNPLTGGIDVARAGGDFNVFALRYNNLIDIEDRWKGVDHNANYRRLTRYFRQYDLDVGLDAQGEGSGLADRLNEKHSVTRFKSGEKASQAGKFKDKWSESLYHLGLFFQNGGKFNNRRLKEELMIAARIVEFKEKHYASRSATVLKATPKRKIKKELGRSPDMLDAALIANWLTSGNHKKLVW